MAGDWIKMRCDLWTHPKIVTLSLRLSVTRSSIIGALHGAWSLLDIHGDDGRLEHFTADSLDAHVELPGFASEMASVGWLVIGDESLQFPNYQQHNGKTAKQRVQTQKRVASSRKRNADVTQERYESVTREEKRREEKKDTPTECLGKTEKPARSKRFVPPTVEDVAGYCCERGNGIDAQRFVDFYEARGWMAGRSKLKDWKAAVRTWERNEGGGGIRGKPAPHSGLMELAAEREQELDEDRTR